MRASRSLCWVTQQWRGTRYSAAVECFWQRRRRRHQDGATAGFAAVGCSANTTQLLQHSLHSRHATCHAQGQLCQAVDCCLSITHNTAPEMSRRSSAPPLGPKDGIQAGRQAARGAVCRIKLDTTVAGGAQCLTCIRFSPACSVDHGRALQSVDAHACRTICRPDCTCGTTMAVSDCAFGR
jgi:hypothetical protein